jgi:hypothetical protein
MEARRPALQLQPALHRISAMVLVGPRAIVCVHVSQLCLGVFVCECECECECVSVSV